MKKLLLILVVSALLFSCQKKLDYFFTTAGSNPGNVQNNEMSTYYLRFKMDGTTRSFNFSNAALISDLGTGGKNITFVGKADALSTNLEGLHMSVYFLKNPPAVGTFKETDNTTEYVLTGDYNPNSSLIGYFAGLHQPSVLPLTITISKLDNSTVKGSFSGAFYKKDLHSGPGTTTEYILFTDGEFNLPIK
jgi:hypothetical protein